MTNVLKLSLNLEVNMDMDMEADTETNTYEVLYVNIYNVSHKKMTFRMISFAFNKRLDGF